MLLRIVGTSLLVLLMPLVATAQESKTVDQLDREVQDLKTRMQTTLENLAKLTDAVTKNAEATIANKASIDSLLEKQTEMLERLGELTNLQQEQFVQQHQILDSIVRKDSNGIDVLRLSANMKKSPQFREELRKVVHDSLDAEGEVIIRNKTALQQRVKVNQKDYDIAAGDILTLNVPVGTLTAQLPGQPLTNWTITAPTYQQKIDIVPDAQTTVTAYRPAETRVTETTLPVTTYRPVTTETPVYVAPSESYYFDPATGLWYSWPF